MIYVVTGGAGFIGSHLIERLILEQHQVVCIDDLSSGDMSYLSDNEELQVIKQPVHDVQETRLPIIDGIFHLAAQASVPKSIDDFYNSSTNNLLSTLKVFDWAIKFNIPIVYASSSAVYGNLPLGYDKKEIFDILSPYAQDKLTMEHYASMVWQVYQTRSIGLRFFNVYGPRQDPTSPYSGVISIFINRLLNNLPVTVNAGYQTRDFVFVSDIVDVLYNSMLLLHKKSFCEMINVGTGKSITIDDLLLSLNKIIKTKPQVIRKKLPPGDPERSSGTYEKLGQLLKSNIEGFTSLETGLMYTVQYYQQNQEN